MLKSLPERSQMRIPLMFQILLGLVFLSIGGCGKNNSSGTTVSIPEVSPLVKESLPKGLQAGGTTLVSAHWQQSKFASSYSPSSTETLASDYIINLFQNEFAGPTGNVQGYLMAKIATVDSRMSLFQGAKKTGCLAGAPASVRMNLSQIDPMLDFTLQDIQCYAPFSSGSTDSGEAFGQDGTTTSLWVQATDSVITQGTPGVFYANVLNAGSTSTSAPETVDGVAMTITPNTSTNTGGHLDITRFIATPTKNTFEMFFGSNGTVIKPMTGTADSYLGTGFRMISDGQHIYADGTLCTGNNATTCTGNSDLTSFTVCLDAATVLPVESTNCTTLATSFTLNNTSASLNFKEITSIDPPSNFTSLPGPTDQNEILILPLCMISSFQTAAQKY